MVKSNARRTLILMVTAMMLIPALSMALSGDDSTTDVDAPGPVSAGTRGAGEGMEPISVTPDPYKDRFNAILPWPTNRTFYSIKWRPGGDYALAVGSGGSLYKVEGSEITRIETATLESLYDVAWKSDGSEAVIVGNHSAFFTWDAVAEDLTGIELTIDQRFLGAAWDPTDTYAMIVGNSGFVGRWNGTDVTSIPTGFTDFLYRIVWRPGGDYALAVGDVGAEGTLPAKRRFQAGQQIVQPADHGLQLLRRGARLDPVAEILLAEPADLIRDPLDPDHAAADHEPQDR